MVNCESTTKFDNQIIQRCWVRFQKFRIPREETLK